MKVPFLHGLAIGLDYGAEMMLHWKYADPMTLSSQAGLALHRGERTTGMALLGRALNWLSPGHTDGALAADQARLELALSEIYTAHLEAQLPHV